MLLGGIDKQQWVVWDKSEDKSKAVALPGTPTNIKDEGLSNNIVNAYKPLTTVAKLFILDICWGPRYIRKVFWKPCVTKKVIGILKTL